VVVVHESDGREIGQVDLSGQCRLDLVDNLLRLELGARRRGTTIRLRLPDPDLVEFIDLLGFSDRLTAE
jgi:hypothetical protein